MSNPLEVMPALVIRSSSLSWCVALSALIICAGCGDASDTVPVRGEVSYRGEPITGGAVTFFPVTGRPVIAPLSEQGEYRTELPPGDYTVTVDVGAELPVGYREGDPPPPPPRLALPPHYTTRARSRLQATVAENQREPIDFALE